MRVSDRQLEVVLKHAIPIERYAKRISEAHELGHGPGSNADICDLGLQRKAQKVWKETLPPPFLSKVADSYGRCAQMMSGALPDDSADGDWDIVCRYLGAVATAIAEDSEQGMNQAPLDMPDIAEMPDVIRYDSLAELMHPDAVEGLRSASVAVARYCRFATQIAPDETQMACLQGLASGEKHADLAERLGYSERHLQRILADMWHQFGVDSAIEGVAFAVDQGWITVPKRT
ncbi:hypothetical protein [Candidatus Poriferisocius sp.]|uniref:hypothetical protein n=1 Tax=Candidatus Poriferisocius sp. TaxID=3101276 RepID=UPI003B02850D